MGPAIFYEQTQFSFVEISIEFVERRLAPVLKLQVDFNDNAGSEPISIYSKFKEDDVLHLNLDMSVYLQRHYFKSRLILYCRYVRSHTWVFLTIREALFNIPVALMEVTFKPDEFRDDRAVERRGCGLCLRV